MGGGGSACKLFATILLHLTPSQGSLRGGGGLGQNIYYHVAAFLISFKGACRQTICHHVAAFDPTPRVGGGRVPGKILTIMLVHS